MEFVLKTENKLDVKIDDTTYQLRKPTLQDQLNLEGSINKAKDGGLSALLPTVGWLEALGLPKDVTLQLTDSQALELINYINGKKN